MYHSDLVGLYKFFRPLLFFIGIRHSNNSILHTKFSTLLLVRVLSLLSYFFPNKIISCSQAAISCHTSIGYDTSKFKYIPNGINTHQFSYERVCRHLPSRASLGFPNCFIQARNGSRFHPQKDHANLLQALSLLPEDINFYCSLVGPGVDSNNIHLVV